MSKLPPFDEIADNFEMLDDWEDRYRYVIELGQMLEALDDAEKTPEAKVQGCVSQVWIAIDVADEAADPIIIFRGESDAMIVRGLVAMLVSFYSGRPASEIVAVDALAVLAKLGLEEHLTAQRTNGLTSMVKRMQAEARLRAPH